MQICHSLVGLFPGQDTDDADSEIVVVDRGFNFYGWSAFWGNGWSLAWFGDDFLKQDRSWDDFGTTMSGI